MEDHDLEFDHDHPDTLSWWLIRRGEWAVAMLAATGGQAVSEAEIVWCRGLVVADDIADCCFYGRPVSVSAMSYTTYDRSVRIARSERIHSDTAKLCFC